MRTRIALTVRGAFALIIGAGCLWGATLIALPDLAYIGSIFLALLVLCLLTQFLGRAMGSLTRSVSSELIGVGRSSVIEVQMQARSLLPTPLGAWTDVLPDGLTGDASGPFPTIDSSINHGVQTMTVRYPTSGARRGVHKIGPFRVTTTDPFGLTKRSTDVGDRTSVTIAPAVVALAALPLSVGEAGGSLHSATAHLGEGSDNLIARPYAPGDSMRRIHWRATAHRDQLMVRQEEKESTPRAIVILDRAASRWSTRAGGSEAKDPSFETILSLCVSVAARLMFEGYLVHVVDQDGIALCDPLNDDLDIPGMLVSFATITSHGADHLGDLRTLSGESAGPVVLLTSRLALEDAAKVSSVAASSTFPVLFAVEAEADALDECHHGGWRTAAVTAADPAERDETVASSWLSVLEQGASRVDR